MEKNKILQSIIFRVSQSDGFVKEKKINREISRSWDRVA